MQSQLSTTELFNLNRRKIVGSIATLFSGAVLAQVMTALALLITARQLNADGYGQYAASIAIVSLTSIFFSLGLDIWLLREGGRESHHIALFTGSVLGIKAFIGLIWMAIFAIAAPLLRQDTYPVSLIRWSLFLILFDTLLATTLTGFKAALRNNVPAILEPIADFLWFLSTILFIFFGIKQPVLFLQTRVLISASALIIAIFLAIRIIGLQFSKGVAIHALKSMFPFATSEFLGMVTLRADVVIIGLTLGEYATGIYSPAVGLINMALLVPMAVYTVMVPVLGKLYKSYPEQAKKTSNRTIILLVAIGSLLTALFFIGSPLIVYILGHSYQASIDVIKILSPVLFFKCISFGMAAIILATDKQSKRTIVQAISATINVVLNFLIVRLLGVQGVAGIYIISEIILLTGYSLVVWNKK